MIVAKFGGTSVASKKGILTIVEIARKMISKKTILVVSAVSGITDRLLSLVSVSRKQQELILRDIKTIHQELIEDLFSDSTSQLRLIKYVETQLEKVGSKSFKNPTPADLDTLASFGEIISSRIISEVLNIHGIVSEQVIATKLIVTDDNFEQADFLPKETERQVRKVLMPLINKGIVPVVTGFIGSTTKGQITTLGRGGSDYSASILAYSLNAEEVQIWTDVDGIMTTDPKIVKNAKSVDFISYEEASELAVLGARVLHPKTILPAIKRNIPVRVLNTLNHTHKGTTILEETHKLNYITSIACKKDIKVIHIHTPRMFHEYGFLHKIFKIFDELAISVDFLSTSEISISLTMDGKYDTTKLLEKLKELAEVEIRNNRATVSVVGKPPKAASVIPGKVYTLFEKKNIDIEMISAGASKINETVVVKQEDADKVVRILHKTFFE